jgi:hypothetical protein
MLSPFTLEVPRAYSSIELSLSARMRPYAWLQSNVTWIAPTQKMRFQ